VAWADATEAATARRSGRERARWGIGEKYR